MMIQFDLKRNMKSFLVMKQHILVQSSIVHFSNNINSYLFCSKFIGMIQFLPDKRTLKWCWAHD